MGKLDADPSGSRKESFTFGRDDGHLFLVAAGAKKLALTSKLTILDTHMGVIAI